MGLTELCEDTKTKIDNSYTYVSNTISEKTSNLISGVRDGSIKKDVDRNDLASVLKINSYFMNKATKYPDKDILSDDLETVNYFSYIIQKYK